MQLKPEEISKVIRSQIKYYENAIQQNETGTILMVGDGIARASAMRGLLPGISNPAAERMPKMRSKPMENPLVSKTTKRNIAMRKKKSIISMGFLLLPHCWVKISKRNMTFCIGSLMKQTRLPYAWMIGKW